MAGVSPNLKVNVAADTSQFDKSMKAAKSEVKDFGQVSDRVLGSLGSAIGIDTQQVEKMASAVRGMGRQMTESGNEGTKAFGQLLSSVNNLTVAFGAIGIAGVVAGFKALNAEAEAFKNTVAGANLEMQTAAYIQTYRQVFHDFNTETGQSVAEFEAAWQKGFARFKANAQQNFVSALTGNGNLFQTAFPVLGTLFGGDRAQQETALAAATQSEQITEQIYKLERQRKEQSVEISKLSAQIADQLGIAKDASVSIADRQAAIAEAERLIEEKRSKTVPLEQQLAALYRQRSSLASDDVKNADATLAQEQRAYDTERAITQEANSLLRTKNSITNATQANNAALQKQLELQKQIAQSRADLAGLDLGVAGIAGPGATTAGGSIIPASVLADFQTQINTQLGNSLFAQIQLEIDKSSLTDISNQLQSTVSQLAAGLGDAIGGLVGDLMTGGDAWGNFSNAALSAFGTMATSVGKIAIECGVAALGIKAALETLGPAGAAVAIGAGIALVSLGAAVRSGLSNVASGSYSSTANIASGSYAAGAGDYTTRDVTVQVTGKLEADGDALVAVLNGTNNRNGYTT